MRYELYTHPITRDRHFKLVISEADIISIGPFTGLDKLLLDDCDRSRKASDKLLGLELVARKVEAQHESTNS